MPVLVQSGRSPSGDRAATWWGPWSGQRLSTPAKASTSGAQARAQLDLFARKRRALTRVIDWSLSRQLMTTSTLIFATPMFHGGRFGSGVLSIDVLPDLAAYRDLVVDLAKHLFLQQHPRRKRVPKGFVESFQLGIRTIQSGSSGPVLERTPISTGASSMLLPFPVADYFERARDVIEEVIAAGGRDDALPGEFPRELGKRFNQFGRGLRDGEYVELLRPGKTSGPRYDKRIRRRIIIQCIGHYEEEVLLVGTINGGVLARETIVIETDEGLIEGKCPPELVRQALTLLEQQVHVAGIGSYNQYDRLERMLRVDEVSPVLDEDADAPASPDGPSSLDTQFADLKRLAHGWFDADTPALDPDGLDAFRSFLGRALEASEIPRPYIYPTPEAEARAEWSLSGWEVSATAHFEARKVYVAATHLKNDSFEEREFDLLAPDAPVEFAKLISGLSARK
jgi:hypothetical protein